MTNISLGAVREVSGNMAKATDSTSVKADLEISYDEEIQEEYILIRGQAPPRSRTAKRLMADQKCIVTINLDASVAKLLDTSYPPSNEGKS